MTVDMFTIIRRGVIKTDTASNIEPEQSQGDFRKQEARVLAEIQRGNLTLKEGISLIQTLENSPSRKFHYKSVSTLDLMTLPIPKLRDITDENRSYFLALNAELKSKFLVLAFCGKNEIELENIIRTKSANLNLSSLSKHEELNYNAIRELEVSVIRAYKASLSVAKESLNAGYIPGGIIVVSGQIGTVRITPENFNKTIVSILGFERLKEMHNALQQLYSKMENLNLNTQGLEVMNELKDREQIAKELLCLGLINDLLKYLRN